MIWRIVVFFLLNAADLGLTHYCIASDMAVEEGSPIINFMLESGGWPLAWSYKLIIPVLVVLALHSFCTAKAFKEIMTGLCVGFGLVVVYSIVVMLWAYL